MTKHKTVRVLAADGANALEMGGKAPTRRAPHRSEAMEDLHQLLGKMGACIEKIDRLLKKHGRNRR